MASKLTLNWVDASDEPSSTGLYFPTMTALNIDHLTDNTSTGALGTIRIALAALSLCNFTSQNVNAINILEVGTPPTNQFAQREIKIRFDYVDSAGFKGSFSVPGPDLAMFAQPGSDTIDMQEVAVAAFVAAVELECVSRFDNTITILRGKVVGRRL